MALIPRTNKVIFERYHLTGKGEVGKSPVQGISFPEVSRIIVLSNQSMVNRMDIIPGMKRPFYKISTYGKREGRYGYSYRG